MPWLLGNEALQFCICNPPPNKRIQQPELSSRQKHLPILRAKRRRRFARFTCKRKLASAPIFPPLTLARLFLQLLCQLHVMSCSSLAGIQTLRGLYWDNGKSNWKRKWKMKWKLVSFWGTPGLYYSITEKKMETTMMGYTGKLGLHWGWAFKSSECQLSMPAALSPNFCNASAIPK